MSEEEYQKLKKSIREVGLQTPIAINADNVVLDGHHRYRGCSELGTEPFTQLLYFPSKQAELRYVIESNLVRRHLNSAQRAALASFASDPASDPDKSAKYNVGDRSLIEIHRWHGDEYKAEGLDAESTIKLDIDENGFVKPDNRTGIDKPIKIEDLESEITAELDELS